MVCAVFLFDLTIRRGMGGARQAGDWLKSIPEYTLIPDSVTSLLRNFIQGEMRGDLTWEPSMWLRFLASSQREQKPA